MLQAGDEPRVCLPGLPQHQLARLLPMGRQLRRLGLLLIEPRTVAGHERFESRTQLVGCDLGQLVHRQQRVLHGSSAGLRRLADGKPGRLHRGGATRALLDRPVHRACAADGELEAVAVLEVEALDLLVVLGPVLLQHVPHRQEHLGTAGVDQQLGLEHPHAQRDRHRRLAVVAQRDLDQHPPKLRVVVPVDPQARIVTQRDRRGLARHEVGQVDRTTLLDRNALVVTDRSTGLRHLLRLDRLVDAPRRSHIERLLIRRHLEPQSHRRRDHQALLRRPILGVVIVGIRLGLVSRVRRDPAPLGDSVVVRPDLDEIPRRVVVDRAPTTSSPSASPARCARRGTATAG